MKWNFKREKLRTENAIVYEPHVYGRQTITSYLGFLKNGPKDRWLYYKVGKNLTLLDNRSVSPCSGLIYSVLTFLF